MHRWVSDLLDGDLLSPAEVSQAFIRESYVDSSTNGLQDDQDLTDAKQWIVSRGKSEWKNQTNLRLIPDGEVDFNADEIVVYVDRAVVSGTVSGRQLDEFNFELEPEKEGWRIRRLVIKQGPKETVVFDFPSGTDNAQP
jgi:hypothetical protein